MDPENPEDPDTVWWEKSKKAAGTKEAEDEDKSSPFYGGLYYWLSTGTLGEVYKEADYLGGAITVDVTLSDGRLLQIHATEWQPMYLVLRDSAKAE